jgi:hypothetical protein
MNKYFKIGDQMFNMFAIDNTVTIPKNAVAMTEQEFNLLMGLKENKIVSKVKK